MYLKSIIKLTYDVHSLGLNLNEKSQLHICENMLEMVMLYLSQTQGNGWAQGNA